jgi:hypothetical protein
MNLRRFLSTRSTLLLFASLCVCLFTFAFTCLGSCRNSTWFFLVQEVCGSKVNRTMLVGVIGVFPADGADGLAAAKKRNHVRLHACTHAFCFECARGMFLFLFLFLCVCVCVCVCVCARARAQISCCCICTRMRVHVR